MVGAKNMGEVPDFAGAPGRDNEKMFHSSKKLLTNDHKLIVGRFKEYDDGVDDNPYAEQTRRAEPQDSGPHFSFVKTMYPKVSEKNTEGEGYPFVVFTSRRHKDSLFFTSTI
jgi:hypothetical protein